MANALNFAAYINARVRAMKSNLMDSGELDALLDCSGPDAMADMLLISTYETEVAEAMARYQGADAVEDGVTRNLINTFSKLRRICKGDLEQLVGIFISRWDLAGVKSLLRNRHHGLDAETGESSLLPCPSLSPPLMNNLASQDSVETLVRALVAWNSALCRPLEEKLAEYQDSRNLRVLEDALDQGYFVSNVRRLESQNSNDAKFLRGLLRMEIDRINIRRLFEPRAAGFEAEDVLSELLPKGTLSDDMLRNIATAGTPERAVEALGMTAYGELGDALAVYAQTGQFSRLERAFESAILDKLRSASQQNALSIAVLMRYAWLKHNEVMNIRMIARGAAVHLPKSRIQEEVIYV
ncbi:MAG: V-type ATPase subunit [Candidatus Hydrogenedentota bacterium]